MEKERAPQRSNSRGGGRVREGRRKRPDFFERIEHGKWEREREILFSEEGIFPFQSAVWSRCVKRSFAVRLYVVKNPDVSVFHEKIYHFLLTFMLFAKRGAK